MVALHRTITDLREELSTQIQSISALRVIDPAYRFSEMKNSDAQIIDEKDCSPRTFQISQQDIVEPVDVGHSTTQNITKFQISFSYPSVGEWSSAAFDDMDHVRHWINTHPSALPGVASRYVMPADAIATQQVPSERRRIWILTVTAYIEVTHEE